MYQDFYGFNEIPFGLTPNPKYIFKTESYLEVTASLRYCISHYKGLIVVTGEVGTGKTTTLRSMMQHVGREILAVYLVNPFLTVHEFYELLIHGFRLGIPAASSKAQVLQTLASFLAHRHSRGMRTVLIADEAHGLAPSLLEEIRLLANIETNSEKLLQIVLSGQPELRETLNQPGLRQLKQRISLRCTIQPLTEVETIKYIRFRMKTAGAGRMDLFDTEALDLICNISRGIPRVINNVCDNALLMGYAEGLQVINREIIEDVADTLDITANETTTIDSIESGAWPRARHATVSDRSHN